MSHASLSLLAAPIFSLRSDGGASLPEVLSLLGGAEEIEFGALRPHQQHGWHAFLVQLAALAVHRRGDRRLDLSPEQWREALLYLTGEAAESAWTLVVDDLAQPAFMQPPVPEGKLAGFKNRIHRPDTLDVLVTAKNHDEKQERIDHARPEHWVFALITLQTMEGFLGRGNYGIARMNGGFASRPGVGLAPGLDRAARFRRDVHAWLDERPRLLDAGFDYAEQAGHTLLWLLPWTGTKRESLSLSELDPLFIEVCRRVRLVTENGGEISARAANTQGPRVDAKHLTGNTGDLWTPVKQDGKALTVGSRGFDYRLVTALLLSSDYPERGKPALRPRDDDGDSPALVAEVLTRGQGTTDGYHQRLVPVPPAIKRRLTRPAERASLAELAKERVERVAVAQRKVLHPTLCKLLQGGSEKLDFRDQRTDRWLSRLDDAVDGIFFDALWEDAADAVPTDEARRRWDRRLVDLAERQLRDAVDAAPVPLATKRRAEARAELMFYGLARNHLPLAFTRDEEHP